MSPARKVASEEHRKMLEAYLGDSEVTLESIGQEYGISRERVRQIISAQDPTAQATRADLRAAARDRELAAEFAAVAQEAIDSGRTCVVCGFWVLRASGELTCTTECAKAYAVLRALPEFSGNRHARYCAESILRYRHRYSATNVAWAEKVVSGDYEGPNRRFVVKGSKRAELIRKHLPELYEELAR